jgi:hypothetical protein
MVGTHPATTDEVHGVWISIGEDGLLRLWELMQSVPEYLELKCDLELHVCDP